MAKAQTQRVRRQLRTDLKKDFAASLKTMTGADLQHIFVRAMASRQALAKLEG